MRSHRLEWTACAVILIALLQFSVSAGHPLPMRVLLALALMGYFVGENIKIPRMLLYLITVALGIFIFRNSPIPPRTSHLVFGSLDYALGIYLAVLIVIFLYRKNTPGERLFLVGLAFAETMVASMVQEVFPFALLLALQVIFLCLWLRSCLMQQASSTVVRGAAFPTINAIVVSFLIGICLAFSLTWLEPKTTRLLAWSQPPLFESAAFATETDLSSVRNMRASSTTVMWWHSPSTPMYVLGQCYDRYEGGKWRSLLERDVVSQAPIETQNFFPLGSGTIFSLKNEGLSSRINGAPILTDQVLLASPQTGTLFVPSDATFAAAHLTTLERNPCGVLFYTPSPSFSGEYQLARNRSRLSAAPENSLFLKRSQELPEKLKPFFSKLAQEVTKGAKSDRERAEMLTEFFHNNFHYGMGYPFNGREDPVKEFLEQRPEAHCELFASGMVLLLRSLGIPSRYVTGFLVREYNPANHRFVVRGRDAHAWVETYLPKYGWTLYDPTPPQVLLGAQPNHWSFVGEGLDFLNFHLHRIRAYLFGKNLKEIFIGIFGRFLEVGQWFVARPLRIGTLLLLMGISLLAKRNVFRYFVSLFRRKTRPLNSPENPSVVRLLNLLVRFDQALKRRKLIRPEALTLLEWSMTLNQASDKELTAGERVFVSNFLKEFCHIRYGIPIPAQADLDELESIAAHLDASLKNKC